LPPRVNPLTKGEEIKPWPGPAPVSKGERTALLRIIDAAANRGREGLRVLEDFARFALDDVGLTDQLKQLRHGLAAELAKFESSSLLAARNTREDVGTQLTAEAERSRADLRAVVAANFKRVQESLRSLEEFGKTFDGHFGAAMKQLRYRVYALERDAATLTGAGPSANCRIEQASLYALVDGRESLAALTALVERLVAAEVDVIQLRDKRLDDRELLARARRLRELTRGTHTLFVMNDRADLAVLGAADGVHVGQEELSVRDARAIVGSQALIGVSTHSLEQARQAVLDGADYIGVGPTFASTTKQFDATQLTGLALLKAVAAEIRLPAFAIGGVNSENLPDVLAAGVSRVAVSGAILSATDPYEATRLLQRQLKQRQQ
jgi:thiamine-phosphate pyrophosphorylase